MKRSISICLLLIAALISCKNKEIFSYEKTIKLDGINPLGIAIASNGFWISDSNENKLYNISEDGSILIAYDSLDRPMHLSSLNYNPIVAEYGLDSISTFINGIKSYIPLPSSPDAPAGVDMNEQSLVVADFYNNRIIYTDQGVDKTFGTEGNEDGEFHYPTDVQLANGKIYVADAYNHRVQVFDSNGGHLQTIGAMDHMDATTGIHITKNWIIATDFENSRVLLYDQEGKLLQIIDQNLDKPTDLLVQNDQLYILNYGNQNIQVYKSTKNK